MPRIQGKPGGGSALRQIMSLRPEIAKPWAALDETIRFGGVLEPALKEEVRRAMAQHSGCLFCASLGTPLDSYDDPRWAVAVDFGIAVMSHPTNISDHDWATLRPYFNDEEIVELSSWIAFMFASELMGVIMKLEPATPEFIATYQSWMQQGVAKANRAAS